MLSAKLRFAYIGSLFAELRSAPRKKLSFLTSCWVPSWHLVPILKDRKVWMQRHVAGTLETEFLDFLSWVKGHCPLWGAGVKPRIPQPF